MATLFEAVRAGKSLAHPATWANVQASTAALRAVLGFAAGAGAFASGGQIHIGPEVVEALAAGAAGLVWGIIECLHVYLAYAGNRDAGLHSGPGGADAGVGGTGAAQGEPGAMD